MVSGHFVRNWRDRCRKIASKTNRNIAVLCVWKVNNHLNSNIRVSRCRVFDWHNLSILNSQFSIVNSLWIVSIYSSESEHHHPLSPDSCHWPLTTAPRYPLSKYRTEYSLTFNRSFLWPSGSSVDSVVSPNEIIRIAPRKSVQNINNILTETKWDQMKLSEMRWGAIGWTEGREINRTICDLTKHSSQYLYAFSMTHFAVRQDV
jgi:hypothetical protein